MTWRAFDLNPYALANRADCASPDRVAGQLDVNDDDSPGADFLDTCARAAADLINFNPGEDVEALDYDGRLHEAIDGCVPIMTHEVWTTFSDLGAWSEDLDELGGATNDMTKNAQIALFLIADRLVRNLVEEFAGVTA